MAGSRKRTETYWQVVQWHNRATKSISAYTSRDSAIRVSYQAFASGEGYPEAIITPDQVTICVDDKGDKGGEAGNYDNLCCIWDQWLKQHPEERAAWDTGPRQARLQILEEQHVPKLRPFSSEAIVANPGWYRHLYGILGMTDEVFETFLHLHRFAIAEKEARKLAEEQGNMAPRRRRPAAAIYLEGYPVVPDHPGVTLERQERACRAYCKRVGYTVYKVFRAATPPSHDVPFRQEIGIEPGHAFVYYQRDSNHAYHAAHNLLDARTIDVIVQFVEIGPSRSLYGDALRNESSGLTRVELASLWEIEPPTEDERRLDELLTRLGQAETEEECSTLTEQVSTLSRRMKKAERRAIVPVTTPALPNANVQAVKPKSCYTCHIRPAREGSAFCSDMCAQAAAERFVQTTTRGWCSTCRSWIGSEGCPHSM